jgi:NAD(P)-dependent dehydrogenase (short-subunit alcohol dehydrogenase family)
MTLRITMCVAICLAAAAAQAETVLITGSNRGIGFELAKQFAQRDWTVIVTSRSPVDDADLIELAGDHKNVRIEYLDVTDHDGIDALAAQLSDTPIDLLINNAATSGGVFTDSLDTLSFDTAEYVYAVNALGPLKVSEAFLDHVAASARKQIVTLNGEGGSIADTRGGTYIFGASKAALNMVMRKLAQDVADKGVTVTLVTPGFVYTMGFADGTFDPEAMPDFVWLHELYEKGFAKPDATEDAVARLIPFMLDLDAATSGQWLTLDGAVVPW